MTWQDKSTDQLLIFNCVQIWRWYILIWLGPMQVNRVVLTGWIKIMWNGGRIIDRTELGWCEPTHPPTILLFDVFFYFLFFVFFSRVKGLMALMLLAHLVKPPVEKSSSLRFRYRLPLRINYSLLPSLTDQMLMIIFSFKILIK